MTRQIKPKKRKTSIIQRIVIGVNKFKFIKHSLSSVNTMALPTVPSEPSNKTLARRRERKRGFLVWDSARLGTYVRAKHGELTI